LERFGKRRVQSFACAWPEKDGAAKSGAGNGFRSPNFWRVTGTGLGSGATAGAGLAGLPLTVFRVNRRAPIALRAAGFDFGEGF